MGKGIKKIKKVSSNNPFVTFCKILSTYKNEEGYNDISNYMDFEQEKKINEMLEKMHMSHHLLNQIAPDTYEFNPFHFSAYKKSETATHGNIKGTMKNYVCKELNKVYKAISKGYEDKQAKIKKLAYKLSGNKEKVESKQYDLIPLDFSHYGTNSIYEDYLKFENFRWLLDKITHDSKSTDPNDYINEEYMISNDCYMSLIHGGFDRLLEKLTLTDAEYINKDYHLSTLTSVFPPIESMLDFRMVTYANQLKWLMCRILDPFKTAFDYIMKEVPNDVTIRGKTKPTICILDDNEIKTGTKYNRNVDEVMNAIKEDDNLKELFDTNNAGYTNLKMNAAIKLVLVIMAYIWGVNSTFLLGENTHPKLFEGVTGLDFRNEHIRMKILKLVDDEVFNLNDDNTRRKICQILIQGISCRDDVIQSICDEYNLNRNALEGRMQNIFKNTEKEEAMTSMEFKRTLPNYDNFLKF